MSMKKTDLAKNLAKKIDSRMKSSAMPERFGKGSGKVPATAEQGARPVAAKPVVVTCRLPADLVARLRERAVDHEGGVNGIVGQALEQWLQSTDAKV